MAVLVPARANGWDCKATVGGGWDCTGDAGRISVPSSPPPPAPPRDRLTPQAPAPAAVKDVPAPPPAPAPSRPVTAEQDSSRSNTPPAATGGQTPAAPSRFEVSPPRPAPGSATPPLASGKPEQATAASEPTRREATAPPLETRALLDAGIPWQSCTRLAAAPQPVAETALVEVTADSAEASVIDDQALFSGNVDLLHGHDRLRAARIAFQRDSGELTASGGVLLSRPDLRLAAEQVHYNLNTRLGHAEQAEYRLPGILARGTAARAELTGPGTGTGRYQRITYTTCPPGNDDWQLTAESLDIDTREGLGTAHGARLSFKGVPMAYVPVLTFPIDDRRRSGLLIPSLGYSDRLGLDLSLPYYFNLAPNYDLTLTPRLLGQRGLLLGGEFRFLTRAHEGRITANYLPHDRQGPTGDSRRGALSLSTDGHYTPHLSSTLRLNYVSDERYLTDFGADLESTSTTHLERTAELRYASDRWQALARVQEFQTIDPLLPKASRPYARLPQLQLAFADSATDVPLRYGLDAEYVRFRKSGGFVEGDRLDLHPTLGLPRQTAFYHLVPSAGLRYTRYRLHNQAPGLSSSPDRFTPILSLDGALYFDRATQWFGQAATQTLEPRLYYLYVPYRKQNDIPLFDTREYDFGLDALFRDNRFTGPDRQGDANRLGLALTSRIRNDSGRELARASIGQVLYLADRKVQLPGVPTAVDDNSAVIGELAVQLGDGWRARGGLQWNPNSDTIEQALAQFSYRQDDDRVINLAYRLRDGLSTHTDLGLIWPIGERTRAIARWNYSLSEGRNLDALAGIEYGKCCWRLRALVRQQVTGTGNTQDLSFLLQLELNGLGKLGDNIDALLKNGIYGYRRDDD